MGAHVTVVTADLSPDQSSTWRKSHHISRTLPAGPRLAGTRLLPHPFSGSLPPLVPHPETSTVPNTCPWRWHISREGVPPVTQSPGKPGVGGTSDSHALVLLGGGAKGKIQLPEHGRCLRNVCWMDARVKLWGWGCACFLFFLWAVHMRRNSEYGEPWMGFQSWFSLN